MAASLPPDVFQQKGVSAHQLHRTLDITYEAAWFLAHRIRECMRTGGWLSLLDGGEAEIVEADETYYGRTANLSHSRRPARRHTQRRAEKQGAARAIVALVERGGNVRTFHVAHADKDTISKIVVDNIAAKSLAHRRKSSLPWRGHTLPRMKRSNTASVSMCAMMCIPTRRKAISRSSNAACAASISTVTRNICIGIWPNTILDSIIAPLLASRTGNVRRLRSKVRLANVSRTNSLTKRSFRIKAGRFCAGVRNINERGRQMNHFITVRWRSQFWIASTPTN